TLRLESKEKSSIIISHRVSSLTEVDNIIVLDKGKIIEKGTHQQLLKQKGFYFSMHNSQSNTTENPI
ncbi:ABC transporter, partial [Flavobacteriales bacterium]|nr:ABC transporter [Flavobacteriales bacterium]